MKYYNTTPEQIKKIKQFIKEFNSKIGYEYIKGYKINYENAGDVLYFKRPIDSVLCPVVRLCYFSPISNVFSCNLLEQALQKLEV